MTETCKYCLAIIVNTSMIDRHYSSDKCKRYKKVFKKLQSQATEFEKYKSELKLEVDANKIAIKKIGSFIKLIETNFNNISSGIVLLLKLQGHTLEEPVEKLKYDPVKELDFEPEKELNKPEKELKFEYLKKPCISTDQIISILTDPEPKVFGKAIDPKPKSKKSIDDKLIISLMKSEKTKKLNNEILKIKKITTKIKTPKKVKTPEIKKVKTPEIKKIKTPEIKTPKKESLKIRKNVLDEETADDETELDNDSDKDDETDNDETEPKDDDELETDDDEIVKTDKEPIKDEDSDNELEIETETEEDDDE